MSGLVQQRAVVLDSILGASSSHHFGIVTRNTDGSVRRSIRAVRSGKSFLGLW